jgi:RNA polymerase sigma-70 factor (ECF subfamily)
MAESPLDAATDQELVARALTRDDRAWAVLVARHHMRLVVAIGETVGAEASVGPLIQETWLRVFQKLHTYRPEHPFGPWLTRVARNLAIDHLRALPPRTMSLDELAVTATPDPQKPPPLQLADRRPDPQRRVDLKEKEALARRLINRLPPRQREAILLARTEFMTHEEGARAMGVPPDTFSSYLSRGEKTLKRLLKEAQLQDT